MATIAVALRPGADRPEGAGVVVESPLLEVSSSELRRRIAAREPITHLIPEAALEVIRGEGVYRGP
jgi:nicotinate-nucleotide adenylyltransferase